MSLTNPQVEKIMREYDKIRADAWADRERRIKEAYSLIPGLKETEQEIADLLFERAKGRLFRDSSEADAQRAASAGTDGGRVVLSEADAERINDAKPVAGETAGILRDADALKLRIQALQRRRRELLAGAGLPPDQLDIRYRCPICRDTGYVDGRKCRCFRQAESDLFFAEQPIRAKLKTDNFENFRLDFYESEKSDEDTESPREHMEDILDYSEGYVGTFGMNSENLLILGATGTGKTFLSHCIAGALIEKGFAVVLLSADELFRILADHALRRDGDDEGAYRFAMESDFLVIDDLGTEVNNTMSNSQLFSCIEKRIQTGRPTLISTNLSLKEIRDNYTDRVVSRIIGSYRILKLFNYDSDIRLKVRQERQRREENE